jgi:hypothetical protein
VVDRFVDTWLAGIAFNARLETIPAQLSIRSRYMPRAVARIPSDVALSRRTDDRGMGAPGLQGCLLAKYSL